MLSSSLLSERLILDLLSWTVIALCAVAFVVSVVQAHHRLRAEHRLQRALQARQAQFREFAAKAERGELSEAEFEAFRQRVKAILAAFDRRDQELVSNAIDQLSPLGRRRYLEKLLDYLTRAPGRPGLGEAAPQ
jgi:hypothetical protein